MRSSVCTVELISIHALREEGDTLPRLLPEMGFNFYPRPPRGGRPHMTSYVNVFQRFLSTPSARRATFWRQKTPGVPFISIHALREEGDISAALADGLTIISIHALREEGDFPPSPSNSAASYFYPRPPRGGRPTAMSAQTDTILFLSTPSARRATMPHPHLTRDEAISIHALREEGDPYCQAWQPEQGQFLSTPSARRATKAARLTSRATRISIHALREEGDH